MKKLISILSAICMAVTMIPFSTYAADITPEIPLDEFTNQLQELQDEYDDNYVSEIILEDDSEFYYVDGKKKPVANSQNKKSQTIVTKNDFEIPFSAIELYVDLPESSTYSLDNENYDDITVDKETAENLGFDVDIEDDKAVLTQPYQTERLIVKSKYDINPLDSVAMVEGYNDLHIVQFDNQESAKYAEEYYNRQKFIEYAEPDLVMSTLEIDYVDKKSIYSDVLSNYGKHLSWGSEVVGIDDYVDFLDDKNELPEIVVGIIDSGIDLDHEFLKNRIIQTNYNVSDTGNKNNEDDDNGHGTHVAGIVADNSTDNVKIKSFKALNNKGRGNTSSICLAIEEAIKSNVNTINMSLGTRGKSTTLEETIKKAINNSITVCVSAGNDGSNAKNYTPANIDECITVAAIDEYDQSPYWTNRGPCIDIVAPGVSIYSTYNDGDYKTLSGTSMACPFVTAATAMLLTRYNDKTPDDICSTIEENGRKWNFNENDTDLYGKLALFIGNADNISKPRTNTPKFNLKSGRYDDSINIEITCDEDAEIYYTIDDSRATKEFGIKYTEPIVIDKVTRVHAVAYADGKLKSFQAKADYYITYTDDENNFTISSEGIITNYTGNNQYLTIPDTISGITVTGIGNSVFFNSDIIMVKFPDTLTYVGEEAFSMCFDLYSVNAKNLKEVDNNSFSNCQLLEKFDFSELEKIGKYAFSGCYSLIEITIPKALEISDYAFSFCNYLKFVNLPLTKKLCYGAFSDCTYLEHISMPNLIETEGEAFAWDNLLKEINCPKLKKMPSNTIFKCNSIENIYIPNVTHIIGNNGFESCEEVKTIFAPALIKAEELPSTNATLYLSEKFDGVLDSSYNYKIIAPINSNAYIQAKENGHKFIPSDSRNESIENPSNVTDLGRSICCSAAGVRFGFTWDNIDEIESLASDIEYGFIYSQKGAENLSIDTVDNKNIKKAVANNRVDHGDTTSFNLVISNIPKTYYDRNITARAYVCIDGMCFYSNIQKGSFSEVAGLVLADDGIDQNTKNVVNNLLNKEA